jgi:hypothetical protein
LSSDGLFFIGSDERLVTMTLAPYEAESLLQELLETHPDLLAGGQMDPRAPRRWLLVKREQGVPDRSDAGTRWSVDHLFVDQDAIPTLVEVKRSTDTRIRREVVGQMLNYAANGVRYWPLADLRTAFLETQAALGNSADDQVRTLCEDPSLTVDVFFARVGDNLRSGRIRMVFVADVIPDELMRITEFLNEQMSPAEVFAVEVKRYRAGGHEGTVIVPAVYGRTAAASVKGGLRRESPNRDEGLRRSPRATIELLELVEAFAAEEALVVHETPSGALLKTPGNASVANVYLGDYNALEVPLQPLRDRGWDPAADEAFAVLSRITTKVLTAKSPNVPPADAVTHWDKVRDVLVHNARLYTGEA